jgi:glutamate-1-semialdehyde 2,1-aminomutase
MKNVAPDGPMYQAGTLSGNPLAMACGLATLDIMKEPGAYETLEQRSGNLAEGLIDAAQEAGVPVAVNRVGSMIGLFFVTEPGKPVLNFADATASDTERYAKFFHAMLDQGVYLAPSQYEALFVGLAHDDEAIEKTIDAAAKAFKAVA